MKLFISIFALACLAGCGSSQGTLGEVSSSLQSVGNAKVNDLNEDEAQAFCATLGATLVANRESFSQMACTIGAITSEEACEEVLANCEGAAEIEISCDYEEDVKNCDATTAEVTACFSDRMQMIKKAANELTCESTQEDIEKLLANQPKSCAKIASSCSAFAE